jgi:hypothetical protein
LILTPFLLSFGHGVANGQQSSLFQELGLFFTASSSSHPELPSPMGLGGFARWGFGDGWLFRLSYHRSWDETEKIGTVCDQYSQRINCRPEPTRTKVRFSGLRGGLSRALRLGRRAELALGGGLSFNHVDPKATDLSGGPADLLIPNSGQIGYLANASLAIAPLPRIPVLLNAGYTGHWVDFNGCSGEDPPQYDPFCGWATLKEVEMGLSVTF